MSALTTTTQPCWSANCCHSEHMGWWWPVFLCRQETNCRCVCEWNPGYLPIASSMMLIWLSEGDRIFGGLSVRGAVEWQTEMKILKMATSCFPSGMCVYDKSIQHEIKAALKMIYVDGIWKYSDWTEVSDELLWWINHPHQGLNISFLSNSCSGTDSTLSL